MGLKADAGLIVDVSLPLGTRFGFVEFQTRQGADAATKLDGILLGGRPIRVGPSNGPIIQPMVQVLLQCVIALLCTKYQL